MTENIFLCRTNMANVFIGLPEHRNSSRVLKPPGGGTSNIFGTEIIPDVIPQHNRSFKEEKNRGSSIQDILRTESSVTKQEQVCTRSSSVVVQQTSTTTSSTDTADQEVAALPDVAAEVTCKIEELKVEERSSSIEATETDGDGNTKVLANESNSERSVEQNSSTKKGASIGDILNQEGLEEKKKIKGQVSQSRVPPGGYSSGLW